MSLKPEYKLSSRGWREERAGRKMNSSQACVPIGLCCNFKQFSGFIKSMQVFCQDLGNFPYIERLP